MEKTFPSDLGLLQRIAGFFRQRNTDAYLVGGSVRDWLLERRSQDLDLAIAGDALHLTRVLADELDAAYVPLDEEHATARAVLHAPAGHVRYVDVARLRGDTLPADLDARDFTVNAMAVPLAEAAAGHLDLIDPLGGLQDLHAAQLRATSKSALEDDALRLLRAVRLAAELDFAIERETQQWMAELAATIREPSSERVRDELVRLFACSGTTGYLQFMDDLGLLAPLFPGLVACKGVAQPARHQWDVFQHSLVALERLEQLLTALGVPDSEEDGSSDLAPDLAQMQVVQRLADFAPQLRTHLRADLVGGRPRFVLLKLVTLLHDVGKPDTQSVDEDGAIHFHKHQQVGADKVSTMLRRLHFGGQEVKIGRTVTRHHGRPKQLAAAEKVTARAIYRLFRDTRDAGVDVVLLSLADALAKSDAPGTAVLEPRLGITHRLLVAWFERRERVVDPPALIRGGDLIEAFDLAPGPIIGEVLEVIREAQVAGEVSTREEALALAQERLAPDAR